MKFSTLASRSIAAFLLLLSSTAMGSTCQSMGDIGNLSCHLITGQHGSPGRLAEIVCKRLTYPANPVPPVRWTFTGRRCNGSNK